MISKAWENVEQQKVFCVRRLRSIVVHKELAKNSTKNYHYHHLIQHHHHHHHYHHPHHNFSRLSIVFREVHLPGFCIPTVNAFLTSMELLQSAQKHARHHVLATLTKYVVEQTD